MSPTQVLNDVPAMLALSVLVAFLGHLAGYERGRISAGWALTWNMFVLVFAISMTTILGLKQVEAGGSWWCEVLYAPTVIGAAVWGVRRGSRLAPKCEADYNDFCCEEY